MAEPKRQNSNAMIDLSAEHLGLADEVEPKVGSRVRIILYGVVRQVEKHATDPTEEGGGGGMIGVDVSNFKIASNNDIAELFEEEFDA